VDKPRDDEGEHMSSEQQSEDTHKTVTIIMNGRPRDVAKDRLSFDDVIELAFPGDPRAETTEFTVAYSKGEDRKPTGTMVSGDSVKVKDGMVFNVTRTDKS
jgi:hypothetical protein